MSNWYFTISDISWAAFLSCHVMICYDYSLSLTLFSSESHRSAARCCKESTRIKPAQSKDTDFLHQTALDCSGRRACTRALAKLAGHIDFFGTFTWQTVKTAPTWWFEHVWNNCYFRPKMRRWSLPTNIAHISPPARWGSLDFHEGATPSRPHSLTPSLLPSPLASCGPCLDLDARSPAWARLNPNPIRSSRCSWARLDLNTC